jgi:hypothetical protein
MKNSASSCNAACVWVKELTAIVAYQSSIYQDQVNAGTSSGTLVPASITAPITGAVASAAAATALPSWAIWLGLGVLVWGLL